MTVKQLIDKLKKFPEDMPVATCSEISRVDIDDPDWICVSRMTKTVKGKPDFEYINLE